MTNLKRPAKAVVQFYNQRGTAEQMDPRKARTPSNGPAYLSCHDFVDNQVRLQLFVLAYNLGNFLRQAVLPQAVGHWTLTTLREKLIKIGAKVVRHARKVVFQMAEVAVPRELLFQTILERIGRLGLANCDVGMNADHDKTTTTTEVVSSYPVETRDWRQKYRRNTCRADKKTGGGLENGLAKL